MENLPSAALTSPELTIAGSHERSGTERDDQSVRNHACTVNIADYYI